MRPPVEVFLASAVIFALAVLGLSLRTIFGRGPLKGQCGAEGGCGHCHDEPKQECSHPEARGCEHGHT
jgi:hypothetical protein